MIMAPKKRDDPLNLTLTEESILNAVLFRERYGLEIMQAIAEASQGKKKIGFSSLYPNLRKLEQKGFVTSRWGDETPEENTGARRRYYQITGSGIAAVNQKQEYLTALQHLTPAIGELSS